MLLDEPTFWLRLEFRLCGEFMGMPTKDLRRLWCDGIEPLEYLLDDPPPRITGRIWFGIGQKQQEKWWFTLLLPSPTVVREAIDWSAVLPPDNVPSGWPSIGKTVTSKSTRRQQFLTSTDFCSVRLDQLYPSQST